MRLNRWENRGNTFYHSKIRIRNNLRIEEVYLAREWP